MASMLMTNAPPSEAKPPSGCVKISGAATTTTSAASLLALPTVLVTVTWYDPPSLDPAFGTVNTAPVPPVIAWSSRYH